MTVSFTSADAVELMVNKLRDLVQKVEADNRYLVRENASLWATVREREDELKEANEAIEELRAMVQRAHTEGRRRPLAIPSIASITLRAIAPTSTTTAAEASRFAIGGERVSSTFWPTWAPYSPENCRWATRTEQNRNKRNVLLYEHGGVTDTLPGWAERVGLPLKLRVRRYGWPLERALQEPHRGWGPGMERGT